MSAVAAVSEDLTSLATPMQESALARVEPEEHIFALAQEVPEHESACAELQKCCPAQASLEGPATEVAMLQEPASTAAQKMVPIDVVLQEARLPASVLQALVPKVGPEARLRASVQ